MKSDRVWVSTSYTDGTTSVVFRPEPTSYCEHVLTHEEALKLKEELERALNSHFLHRFPGVTPPELNDANVSEA